MYSITYFEIRHNMSFKSNHSASPDPEKLPLIYSPPQYPFLSSILKLLLVFIVASTIVTFVTIINNAKESINYVHSGEECHFEGKLACGFPKNGSKGNL